MSKRNIESFLTLARRGWPLFPVGEDKLPCVKDWENAATTDEARLREQFSNLMLDHECNFGFPPGRADLLVIDVDLKKVNPAAHIHSKNPVRRFPFLLHSGGTAQQEQLPAGRGHQVQRRVCDRAGKRRQPGMLRNHARSGTGRAAGLVQKSVQPPGGT